MVDDVQVARALLAKKKNAESRKIPFSLSFKKMKQLVSRKTCFYTGIVMTKTLATGNGTGSTDLLDRSIDRIDGSKGYTDDNVVICIKSFNSLKSNLDNEHLYKVLKAVTKLKEKNGKVR